MTSPAYDILRKETASLVWIEAAHDLEMAKKRMKELAANSRGEYVVFDQRTRKFVAQFTTPALAT